MRVSEPWSLYKAAAAITLSTWWLCYRKVEWKSIWRHEPSATPTPNHEHRRRANESCSRRRNSRCQLGGPCMAAADEPAQRTADDSAATVRTDPGPTPFGTHCRHCSRATRSRDVGGAVRSPATRYSTALKPVKPSSRRRCELSSTSFSEARWLHSFPPSTAPLSQVSPTATCDCWTPTFEVRDARGSRTRGFPQFKSPSNPALLNGVASPLPFQSKVLPQGK